MNEMSEDKIEDYIKSHLDFEGDQFDEDEFSEVIYNNLKTNDYVSDETKESKSEKSK